MVRLGVPYRQHRFDAARFMFDCSSALMARGADWRDLEKGVEMQPGFFEVMAQCLEVICIADFLQICTLLELDPADYSDSRWMDMPYRKPDIDDDQIPF